MSKNMLILTLSIVLLILISLGIFLYVSLTQKTRFKKQWQEIKDKVPFDALKKVKSTLNRVDIITRANDKFINVNKKISKIYDDIEREFRAIAKIEEKVELIFNRKKINKKKIKAAMDIAEKYIVTTNKMFDAFFDTANQVTHQDEFMRNEFVFYQNHLRKVAELYSEKRINLQNIAKQIDKLNLSIKKLEREFQELIIAANSVKGSEILRKYVSKVMKLTNIVNEGPSINSILQTQIPNMALTLERFYLEKKKEILAPMEHIDFKKSMIKISKSYKKAKESFKNIEVTKTKEIIKKIFKGFKTLENLINLEIRSRNKFVSNYSQTLREITRVLKHFVYIKNQYKKLASSGKNVPIQVKTQFEEVKKHSKDLDELALDFRKTGENKTLPYSSKLSRMKLSLASADRLIEELNEFVENLWTINLQESITKNKFVRVEAAFNELITTAKQYQIKMDIHQQREFARLTNLKTEISNTLKIKINKEVMEKVDSFVKQFADFYTMINGQTQIALHVQNMIKELAPLRSSSSQLNYDLQNAEKNYLEGKYAVALNGIIESVLRGSV